MALNIIFSGLGGQGVVFLTRLIANAAMLQGTAVIGTETHGLSQRGGPVMTHLKLGTATSPLILRGTAHLLVALDHNEALSQLTNLGSNSRVILASKTTFPQEILFHLNNSAIEVFHVDPLLRANIFLAGCIAGQYSQYLPFENVQAALNQISKRDRDENFEALLCGYHHSNTGVTWHG